MVQKQKVPRCKRLRSPPRTQLKVGRVAKRQIRSSDKSKRVLRKVGRPPKIPRIAKNPLVKLPVVPVMEASVTDVRRRKDKKNDPIRSPSRYIIVTPYRQGGSCVQSSSPSRKPCRASQRSPPRSVSQPRSRSVSRDKRGNYRHRSRHRSQSISRDRRGKCQCSCRPCQKCERKTHRRSCSNSKEHGRRQSGSPCSCSGSRSDSEPRKMKPRSPKKTSREKAEQSPDAPKTVKSFIERVSTVFSRRECTGGNNIVKKNISSNKDMEKEKPRESRRSRSPNEDMKKEQPRKSRSSSKDMEKEQPRKSRSPSEDMEKEQPRESRRSRSPSEDMEKEQPHESRRSRSPNKNMEKEQPHESRSSNEDMEKEQPREARRSKSRSPPRRRHHRQRSPEENRSVPMCCVM